MGDRKGIFIDEDELHGRLICIFCDLVSKDAVQSNCGHTFCVLCVKGKLQSLSNGSTLRCPACPDDDEDAVITQKTILPDFYARKKIKRLKTKCMNEGCSWQGIYADYMEHEPQCNFAQIKCKCSKLIRRGNLESHVEDDCPMREVKCRHCNGKYAFVNIKKHNETCTKVQVVCPDCQTKILREHLEAHQDLNTGDCPNKRVPCPYAEVGCTARVMEGEMDVHLQSYIMHHTHLKYNQLKEETVGRCQKLESNHQQMRALFAVLDRRNDTLQEVISVLNNQLEALSTSSRDLERRVSGFERRLEGTDQMFTLKNIALAEQELRIQSLESAAYNGVLVWKITDFARRRSDAINEYITSLYSPPFYTSFHGYKMCARINLNGDGMGKGTHVSLFFVVMKGRYDNTLRWPFRQKVTFMLVDQSKKEHVVDAFRPDQTSSSFQKPTSEMNVASGLPCFVPLSHLHNQNYAYIRDDCLFVKVIVDVTDLQRL